MKLINQKKGDILVRIDPLDHQFLYNYVLNEKLKGNATISMASIIRESITKTIKNLKK